jgi:hypothetical protein
MVRQWPDAGMVEDEEPRLSAYLTRMLSNADLDCLIADLRTNPLAPQELRQVREGVYVSLKQSQPEGLRYKFCLSSGPSMYFFFSESATDSNP